ncbi:MAG: SDR family oxidoreductase [Polyangiales bacterium]|jgi:NAD(P)-dependent dehydrogenase (short-subunit alcohol dehydrogenase family)
MSENENPVPVAIVTGASSGIGEATAKCLAKAGYSVVVAARRAELLDRLVAEIRAQGGTALSVPTDLSDAEQTSALVKTALDSFGRVDVLVNNAGYSPPYALEQMDRDAMRHVLDVNLLSGMQLIAELTPTMREQGGGRIINISSLTRYVGAPMVASYAASKGGMEAMTACMRLELSSWNIKLVVIVPGFVDTPILETSRAAGQHLQSDPSNPYLKLAAGLESFANEQLKSAISSQDVGRAVVQAATSPSPKTRYFVPKGARTAARMFGALPDLMADRLLLKMYKWGPWA